jgi:hypothetical protein
MGLEHLTAVLDHSRQGNSRLVVLMIVASYSDQRGEWIVDQATLQKRARLGRRRVQQVLDELVAAGELAVVPGDGRGHHSTYRLTVGAERAKETAPFPEKGEEECTLSLPQKGEAECTLSAKKGAEECTLSAGKGEAECTLSAPLAPPFPPLPPFPPVDLPRFSGQFRFWLNSSLLVGRTWLNSLPSTIQTSRGLTPVVDAL